MAIFILSEKPLIQRVLNDALKQAKLEITENEKEADLALCDTTNTKNRDDLPCPFIDIHNTTPLRLGQLINTIKHRLKIIEISKNNTPIKIGDRVLDPQNSSLMKKGQDPTFLTEKEVMILSFIFGSNPAPVSRQALLDNVWGYADNIETHTLETHIYRLRQKIEEDPAKPSFLITTDDGYRLSF